MSYHQKELVGHTPTPSYPTSNTGQLAMSLIPPWPRPPTDESKEANQKRQQPAQPRMRAQVIAISNIQLRTGNRYN